MSQRRDVQLCASTKPGRALWRSRAEHAEHRPAIVPRTDERQVFAPTSVSPLHQPDQVLAPTCASVIAYRRAATLLWQREAVGARARREHSYMKTARITVGAMIVVASVAIGMSLGDSVLAQGG